MTIFNYINEILDPRADINALSFMMNPGGILHALSECDKTAVKKSRFSPVNLVLKSGKKEQVHHEKTGKNFNHEK
ncbi:hypothetical protein [Photorhabdus thracensis]|uniref:hypothetical protein n=1 Tax=Photorhabdus thracensis TaxID=230089 RepID=UPI001E2D6A85|nr:hypothetical protein [Photorhabdus thracensis]MCC8419456.1 hypothetical protein [Photorhabdus thracensis]